MIQSKQRLVARISSRGNLRGSLNNAVVKEYPELENLEVTPSGEQQVFKSDKYGYDTVTVKEVESESLNIVPGAEEQSYSGLYNNVTVAGDSNFTEENIREGISIFGKMGTAKTTNLKITDASYLFYNNSRLDIMDKILPLCDEVTTVMYMFSGCSKLENLDLSNVNTSEVKSMYYMFQGCSGLTSLDLSKFNTSKVTVLSNMFTSCRNLTSLDLSNFDTRNVTGMGAMCSACSNLISINVSSFDTSLVEDASYMFNGCNLLENLDLSNFDFGKVNKIGSILNQCYELTNLKSFKNLGKGYITKREEYSDYTLNVSSCSKLTYESLMDIINNLYDLILTYDVANGGTLYRQKLVLGSTNLAKLTEEEVSIATNKGWNVS